jgi:signal transduction histidine kinase
MTPDQIVKTVAPTTLDQALLTRHGSGLGLCITKRLTELYQGSFAVQGEPGRGTTVTVRLPKARAK